MNNLCIFGAGGHGKVAASIAELLGYKNIYFFDDDPTKRGSSPWPYMGTYSKFLSAAKNSDVFVAVGNCHVREEISIDVIDKGLNLVNLVHPSATVSYYSTFGNGVIVVAGAVINPFCTISDGAIINTGATVGHDCQIHSYAHIAPGVSIAGHCTIESKVWIGISSTLIQGIAVGEGTLVGAGSVVVEDIGKGLVAYGNPARVRNTQ